MTLIFWLAYDSYKQSSLVSKGEKLPPNAFRNLDGITNQVIPKDKAFQVVFLYSTEDRESLWAAKSLNLIKSLLPEKFQILAIANAYKTRDEVSQFKLARLNVDTFLGHSKALIDFKVSELPMFYFVNPQGTVKGSTLGFTTPLGILIRAYFCNEDSEDSTWHLNF
jgi:hypothetical protein